MLIVERLHETIAAVAPIRGVSVPVIGQSNSVVIDFLPEATAEQRTAAQAVLASFDWSAEAHSLWESNRSPEKRDLAAMVAAHLVDLQFIVDAASFTNTQRDNAIKKLAQGQKAIIKRLIQLN